MTNQITPNAIVTPRTARYYTLGTACPATREVWFACHGYGQLAEYFARHFSHIASKERLVVVPEGLSRFYLDGPGGRRVGATWMTKEDRLNEIEDYIKYLDKISREIFNRIPREQVKVTALGFSQGTATVSRWITRGDINADRLILWAGMLPPELDLAACHPLFNRLNLTLVLGDQDEYARPAIIEKQETLLNTHGIRFRNIRFSGTHKLNSEVLETLAMEMSIQK